jgi:soluble lytic murein transglycosylase
VLALALAAPLVGSDLAPVLEGKAAGAPAALEAGRFDDALRSLDGTDRPEASLLRARALSHLGRHAEAVAALDGLEKALPEIADRVHFLRGRELAALDRHLEAAAAWASVAPGSVLADAAAVARGRSLAAAGQAEEAFRVLGPIGERPAPQDLSQEDPAASALAAMAALVAPREPAGARRALLSCWMDHPLAPESDGCLAALRRLPGEAGGSPSAEQELVRAERLLEANRNRGAIAALERLVPLAGEAGPEAPMACRARSALGRAYRKERQHARAIELLRPVVARCKEARLRTRSLFVLAGSVSIAGDREEALALYLRLAKEEPDSSLADDALVSAADLLERLGRPAQALEQFAAAAQSASGDGDRRAEALFRGVGPPESG